MESGDTGRLGEYGSRDRAQEEALFRLAVNLLFDGHILKLAGLEHLAALQAFDVLSVVVARNHLYLRVAAWGCALGVRRSEEHTSELQSHLNLVCRLLLEKKKYTEI